MATRVQPIYADNPGGIPASYALPPSLDLELYAIRARVNGAGASGTFIMVAEALTSDGRIMAQSKIRQTFAVGDTGALTWAPFLGQGAQAGTSTIAAGSFAEAAGFLEITSTDFANPTIVVSAPAVTADGATTYRIDFCVATVDISCTNTGAGASLNLQLVRGSTILGIIANFNIEPVAGFYGSVPIGVSAFDTPPAGSHTYKIGGVKGLSGGATATMRVFGSNAGSPFDTVTHPGFIGVSAVEVV